MSLIRFSARQFHGLMLASAALLLTFGCGSKSKTDTTTTAPVETVVISGKVTYVRIPTHLDANGIPTGPETDTAKFLTLPAQGVVVRFIEKAEETQLDGTKTTVWKVIANTVTSSTGTYSLNAPKNTPVFAEVISRFNATNLTLRLIGDVAIGSSVPQADRRLYSLRKGLDGSAPAGNAVPTGAVSAATTLDFNVGLTDKWWLTQEAVSQVPTAIQESVGTGSRVLAIGDSAVAFTNAYGTPVFGNTLDLHYRPGTSEPRGTFIEFDTTVYPFSFDGGTGLRHYFGSIRGDASNDDSFDEGVLYSLLARSNLHTLNPLGLAPIQVPLTNLSPDLAVLEGLADAMAANLTKSPYLADLTPASATYRDIRNISSLALADRTPYSAPLISAVAWDLLLKANSLPNPGTPVDWAKINPLAMLRFFQLRAPSDSSAVVNDVVSVYGQLARLKETKSSIDPVDLAALLPDSVLTPLLQPFNLTWPRPTTGEYASFLKDWGKDPNSLTTALPTFTLSMANAVQMDGSYPNLSPKEIAYARFNLAKDTAYNVKIDTVPASLPPTAQIQVRIDSQIALFSGSATPSQRMVFVGNATTPVVHSVRVRLLSPTTLQPDIQVTVRLDVAP